MGRSFPESGFLGTATTTTSLSSRVNVLPCINVVSGVGQLIGGYRVHTMSAKTTLTKNAEAATSMIEAAMSPLGPGPLDIVFDAVRAVGGSQQNRIHFSRPRNRIRLGS